MLLIGATMMAKTETVPSSNNRLELTFSDEGGVATYSISYDGVPVLTTSRLGFEADFGDFTKGLKMGDYKRQDKDIVVPFTNAKGQQMKVIFHLTNNSIAFRYEIPRPGENPKCAVIRREMSSFNFPESTSTFLCPQIGPMTGWERTKPSYEEDYKADAPMTDRSQFGQGYTFPCLFKAPLLSPPGGTAYLTYIRNSSACSKESSLPTSSSRRFSCAFPLKKHWEAYCK